MSITVCLLANSLYSSHAGGHMRVISNRALGLHALGCQVIWLESIRPNSAAHEVLPSVDTLKSCLERYGLAGCMALCSQ